MSNLQRHKECSMRSEIGNCLAIGGFCTSVSKEICEGLQNAYANGKYSAEVRKDPISRADLIKRSDAIDELKHIIPYKRYHNGEYVFLLDKRKCLKAIRRIPTADIPQGHYIKGENGEWYCSVCKRIDDKYSVARFCWYCGSKMEGYIQ